MASPMVLVTKHQERARSVCRPCRRVGTLARRRGGADAPGTSHERQEALLLLSSRNNVGNARVVLEDLLPLELVLVHR